MPLSGHSEFGVPAVEVALVAVEERWTMELASVTEVIDVSVQVWALVDLASAEEIRTYPDDSGRHGVRHWDR